MNLRFMLLTFIFLTMLASSCSFFKYPRNGVYLIPKGYRGEVIILLDQPDGIVPEVEDGLYVYEIPTDGLLKIKTKGYSGIVDLRYFYVDENGQREEIKYLHVTGERDMYGKPKDKFDGQINQEEYDTGVFIMGAGGVATTNSGGKIFSYTGFVVGAPRDIEQLFEKREKRVSDIHCEFLRNN